MSFLDRTKGFYSAKIILLSPILIGSILSHMFNNELILRAFLGIFAVIYFSVGMFIQPALLFDRFARFGVSAKSARLLVFAFAFCFSSLVVYIPGNHDRDLIIFILLFGFLVCIIWSTFISLYWEVED